ncbi:MAG: CAP domain-containing protein [Chloroflexota bacterium]
MTSAARSLQRLLRRISILLSALLIFAGAVMLVSVFSEYRTRHETLNAIPTPTDSANPSITYREPPGSPRDAFGAAVNVSSSSASGDTLISHMNSARSSAGLNPVSQSAPLSRIAVRYAQQFAVNGQVDTVAFDVLRYDLTTEGYFLGGQIYQLHGFVNGGLGSLSQYVASSFRQDILDPEVADVGFGYSASEGGHYFALLLAEPIALTAPGASLAGRGGSSQEAQQAEILRLLNAARQQVGLVPLRIDPRLVNASYEHSTDMARTRIMAHTGSDGSMPVDRALAYGYTSSYVGENVLVQPELHAAGAFDLWWNSPSHYEAMMNSRFTDVGITYAIGADGNYYYTMLLGGA